MKGWNIEHLDFRNLISKYDSPTTFFYLDPPYVRSGKNYNHSFVMNDFIDLKNILDNLKGYWLMNETDLDFSEIKQIFGEPVFVKEYSTYLRNRKQLEKNGKNKTRLEGFWGNFDKEVKK